MSGVLRKLRRQAGIGHDIVPVRPSSDLAVGKISAVILDFAQPLLERFPDDCDFEPAIKLAVACWNIALFPEPDQKQELQSLLKEMAKGPADLAGEIQTWVKMLVDRKKTLFGRDRRMVMNYRIVEEEDSHHLYVVSTLMPD